MQLRRNRYWFRRADDLRLYGRVNRRACGGCRRGLLRNQLARALRLDKADEQKNSNYDEGDIFQGGLQKVLQEQSANSGDFARRLSTPEQAKYTRDARHPTRSVDPADRDCGSFATYPLRAC